MGILEAELSEFKSPDRDVLESGGIGVQLDLYRLIERNPLPPGGVSYLLCSLIKICE